MRRRNGQPGFPRPAHSSRDADNTPANVPATRDVYHHRQFSAEVHAAGTALHERLDWLAGLYSASNRSLKRYPFSSPQTGPGVAEHGTFRAASTRYNSPKTLPNILFVSLLISLIQSS